MNIFLSSWLSFIFSKWYIFLFTNLWLTFITGSFHIKSPKISEVPMVTSQIFLKVKPSDGFTEKILSWKFQLYSSHDSKVITIWIFPKISLNCLPSATSKMLPTSESNNSPRKKTAGLKFELPAVFDTNKPFLPLEFIKNIRYISLKIFSSAVKVCQLCSKITYLGSPESFWGSSEISISRKIL